MKICLVSAFPPSKRQLNEYSYHLAKELKEYPEIELTVLADELENYDFAPDPTSSTGQNTAEVIDSAYNVVRCWKFGSLSTPLRILNQVRRIKPDVVWFNLAFSTFGTPKNPIPAFAGLSIPAMVHAAGFYTHITLHHIIEHVDFATSGIRLERLYRLGSDMATQALLKVDSVSVLLSDYRNTLIQKYDAENVMIGTHGTFSTVPVPPDFTKRGNPDLRILAFGNWGTYKRLEPLMEAFPHVLAEVPNARLIVAGGNHPAAAGYWESIRAAQPIHLPIEFRGYIPQDDIADLFGSSSVLVMPYESSTGSSGPAHQACEFGLPIVCADIKDFRCMAHDDEMAINFYEKNNPQDLAGKLVELLNSHEMMRRMSLQNYEAGVQMCMSNVVHNYLRWFELQLCKSRLAKTVPGIEFVSRLPWSEEIRVRNSTSERILAFTSKRVAS
jgi:glycosyltransferase involved in cell wall biosynthesis